MLTDSISFLFIQNYLHETPPEVTCVKTCHSEKWKCLFLAEAKRLSKSKFHILYILYILYSLDCFRDAGVACGSVTAKSRVEHVITAVSSQNEAVCYYGCLIGQYEASLNVLTKIL